MKERVDVLEHAKAFGLRHVHAPVTVGIQTEAEQDARQIFTRLALAVKAAHQAGVVLRNIKVGTECHMVKTSSCQARAKDFSQIYDTYDWPRVGVSPSDHQIRDKFRVLPDGNRSAIAAALVTYSRPLASEARPQQWLASFYWAVTTMSTVGYGDI